MRFDRLAVAVWVAAVFALAGCDQQRIAKLEEGVATEADVKREFGGKTRNFISYAGRGMGGAAQSLAAMLSGLHASRAGGSAPAGACP